MSREEYDNHRIAHLPFRSWCDHCVKGKVREHDHPAHQPEPNEVPMISIDYCFLGRALDKGKDPEKIEDVKTPSDEAEGVVPILVVYGHRSGCTSAGVVNKGVDPYAIAVLTDAFRFCGRQTAILMSHGEPSIKALAEAARKVGARRFC